MSEHATDVAEAEEAFVNSLPETLAEDAPEAPQPVEAAPEAEGTTEEPAEESQEDPLALPDSFTPLDVRGMLESIEDPKAREVAEAAYKNLQADYTRSKQQVAEQAKAFEGLDDLEKAKAAVEFYDGIQNDPEYAMQVRDYLTSVFEEAGLTPAEAASAAQAQMETPAQAVEAPSYDDDPDAALKAKLETLEQRFQSWEEQEQERQARQREDALAADLLRQEMAISQANPTLTEKDWNRIYDLAAARGGNLGEAWNQYQEMQQDFIADYIALKQTNVPPSEPAPSAATAPPGIPRLADGSVDMDAVHKMATQRLQNAMSGQD